MLYAEEHQILAEFSQVKDCLQTTGLDEETFEAARETCLVLGGKLGSIRNQQSRCYTDTRQLELNIDQEILASKIEDADLADIDLRLGLSEETSFHFTVNTFSTIWTFELLP